MLVEGHPEACPLVRRHGGIQALASMLHQAGAQAKKAAAEALQVRLTHTGGVCVSFCSIASPAVTDTSAKHHHMIARLALWWKTLHLCL